MSFSPAAVRDKIAEMYPEIDEHKLTLSVEFDTAKDAYVVKLQKNHQKLTTYLEKKDAEDCLRNIKCVYLGTQIGQFVKNFPKS